MPPLRSLIEADTGKQKNVLQAAESLYESTYFPYVHRPFRGGRDGGSQRD